MTTALARFDVACGVQREIVATERQRGLLMLGLVSLSLVLGVIAFLPWGRWLGSAPYHEVTRYTRAAQGWAVWLGLSLPIATGVAFLWGSRVDDFFERARRRVIDLPYRVFGLSFAAGLGVTAALLSGALFQHNPHLVDTIAQLFQARIFAQGSLTAPAPHDMEFFAASNLVENAGRWFSQYPPGHPALLAGGLLAGVPWLVNPIFAAGTLLIAYAAARRLLGEGSARLAVALFVISPFVLFMSASYMNHVTTGFFLALALYAAVRATESDGGGVWPWALGLALAAAATIRPLESLAWAIVLGLWVLMRRGWKPAFAAGVACVVGLVPLLAYNGLTTGRPLRFGYTLLWGEGHGLGFRTDPWGEPFTPLVSFVNTAVDFQRLGVFLFEWPFPSLIFILAALVVGGIDERVKKAVPLLAGLLLAAPFAYFFYWHRDNYLGPRFLYASLLPAILLTVIGIVALDQRLGRWRAAFRITLLAGVFFGLVVNVPESAGVIAGMEPEMKLHPEVQAESKGLEEAVVFVKVGWGSRLVGRLWGWRVPASEAERTFRVVDGCRLQSALDEADSLAAAGRDSAEVLGHLREQLEVWRKAGIPVQKGLLPDPSVRVDTTRALFRRCYKEVQLDRSGFTLYGTLVWRNDPWLQRGVIYARYLEQERNRRLLKRYPGRDFYLYAPLSPERGAPTELLRLEGR